jgi:hypothetical protein
MTTRRWWLLAGTLVLLTTLASVGGLRNGLAYDDRYIIFLNDRVHTLKGWWRVFDSTYWPPAWGGDGYRPITILAFAIEWATGRGAPWIFHLVNIALYCATTVAVFWLASALLPEFAAWMTAALFAVHPVHVEAVANVVGQSELWVALALTWTTALYIRSRRRGPLRPRTIAVILLVYVAACFAKEHAIVLPALLLAAELTVIDDPRPLRQRLAAFRLFGLLLTLGALVYMFARTLVVTAGLSGFAPYVVFQSLQLSYANRVLTMIGVVPQWVRLFLWPARLVTDYSPPYVDIAQGPALNQLPGLLLLLGILGLAVALHKRRPAITFGIVWLCIALLPVSNFIVAAGIIIAERTLFLPSIGAMLAVGGVVAWLEPHLVRRRWQVVTAAASVAILAAGAWRSVDRTAVWKDNDTLFRQSVIDAPLAYRAHYMLGAWLFENKRKLEGEREYRRALALFPYDPFMAYNLAENYRQAGMCRAAIPLYKWAFDLRPNLEAAHAPYALCQLLEQYFADARATAFTGMRAEGGKKILREIVIKADSAIANTGRTGPPSVNDTTAPRRRRLVHRVTATPAQ